MKTCHATEHEPSVTAYMERLMSKAHGYCTRRCGKWGGGTCFSCMFRDVRKYAKIDKEYQDVLAQMQV